MIRLLPTPETPLQLGIVIPVLNEAANIAPLIERIDVALAGIVWEALIVDDNSPDGTAEVVRAQARQDPRVRIVQRIGRRGLSSAVVEGMLASGAPVLAVIDGDMQHDEAILPTMYRAVAEQDHDLAVGTRYVDGGSTGDWDASREKMSHFATALSRRLLKTEMSDPMSGFFAVRREAMVAALPHLSSIGFKILMDMVASSPTRLRIVEIPYTFRNRVHGESKFDARIAQEFAILLLEKLFGPFLPIRFLMFAMVGSIGLIVHLAVLGGGVAAGLTFQLAQSMAVMTAMTGNFFLNNSLTFRDMRLRGPALWRGLISFYLVGLIGAIGNVGVGALVYRMEGIWWLAGIAGVAVGVVWNYAASSVVTWRVRK
ncbi:MAG: glycosyltransferase family 2 protein [Tepidisphaeraceae bacterium]